MSTKTDQAVYIYEEKCKSILEAVKENSSALETARNELLKAALILHDTILPEELNLERLLMKAEILKVLEEESAKSEIEMNEKISPD